MFIVVQANASKNSVKKYVASFKGSGFSFEEVNAWNDKELKDLSGKSSEQVPNSRMQAM